MVPKIRVKLFGLLLTVALVLPVASWGKRAPPKPVIPVTHDGVTYSAAGDGTAAFVVATETSSGRELWKVEVFKVRIDPLLEEDVQWVFITELKVSGNSLLIRDERGRCYRLNLTTREHQGVSCFWHWLACSSQTQSFKEASQKPPEESGPVTRSA